MSDPAAADISLISKILAHEARDGYQDRVVIGGLEGFIRGWVDINQPVLAANPGAAALKAFYPDKSSYAHKSLAEREAWIKKLMVWLGTVEHLPSPPAKTGQSVTVEAPAGPVRHRQANGGNAGLDSLVDNVSGIGAKMVAKLGKLRLRSVRDLLYFFPRRFMDFSQRRTVSSLETGREQTIFANVWEARQVMLGRRKSSEAVVGDETGNARAVWFNQPWVAQQLKTNAYISLSGRVKEFNYVKVFENPEWELIEDRELVHTGRLVPVYQLTQGLFPRQVRNWVKSVLDDYLQQVTDFLPAGIRERCRLMGLQQAILKAHYPDDYAAQNMARQRLAFDELFLLQLGVLGKKREWQEEQPGHSLDIDQGRVSRFVDSLPFKMTPAQQKVTAEICGDLRREVPMPRLLQGDVGSGKTVVATIALLTAVWNGYQGALMAPTEILAEQHFATLSKLLSAVSGDSSRQSNIYTFQPEGERELKVALLTGSLNARDKAATHDMIRRGGIDLVVGTHALVQKGVKFVRLGIAVIDEQHRFGVVQRTTLRQKGFNPHLLVMTATPIPRTLALTLYGDLDISTIDQMPAGRLAIKTKWITQDDRQKAYNFIRKQVAGGRQAFVICPLIEESENLEVKAAVAEHQRLSSDVFPTLRLGLLHGKMKGADKEEVMHSFKDGKLDILVSTSVVEVGIDVPNATVMLVEAADRFGLAQLHQFRGRVGRGWHQSYCMLLSENPSEYGQERLKAIEEINDGFALAEKDLELRGPGEFFGTRQSGLPDLKMARLSDTRLLETARREARAIFQKDPALKDPENRLLAMEYRKIWHKDTENN
jgi:ATP-dependent DNA helicase RecG